MARSVLGYRCRLSKLAACGVSTAALFLMMCACAHGEPLANHAHTGRPAASTFKATLGGPGNTLRGKAQGPARSLRLAEHRLLRGADQHNSNYPYARQPVVTITVSGDQAIRDLPATTHSLLPPSQPSRDGSNGRQLERRGIRPTLPGRSARPSVGGTCPNPVPVGSQIPRPDPASVVGELESTTNYLKQELLGFVGQLLPVTVISPRTSAFSSLTALGRSAEDLASMTGSRLPMTPTASGHIRSSLQRAVVSNLSPLQQSSSQNEHRVWLAVGTSATTVSRAVWGLCTGFALVLCLVLSTISLPNSWALRAFTAPLKTPG